MSSKNDLQEYCQKRRWALPKYITERCGGSDHQPLWRSTVDLGGTAITGWIQSNRVEAEQQVAGAALRYLASMAIAPPKRTIAPGTVLLVDIENMPKFIDAVVAEVEGLDIFGFVGMHHSLAHRELPTPAIKMVTPSTRPDATDTYIQTYAGYLISQQRYTTYLIATRDHFGSALVDIITNAFPHVTRAQLHATDSQLQLQARVVTDVCHI